nr:unknown [Zea mays]
MGQGLSVGVDDLSSGHCLCKADIKPWLFSKKKGSRSLDVEDGKVEIFWDLSGARFGAGPEPVEGFYVAVVFDLELALLLGDMKKDAYRKTGASQSTLNAAAFVARREHIYGKKIYSAKAQFCDNGQFHDIAIECDTVGFKDPCLEIRVDKKPVMQVKRLAWKFRGNQAILVDGLPVEVFWDVHSWLFGSTASNAVFMFQTRQAPEKSLPWSYSQNFRESQLQGLGFSLILHAWKVE